LVQKKVMWSVGCCVNSNYVFRIGILTTGEHSIFKEPSAITDSSEDSTNISRSTLNYISNSDKVMIRT